MKIYIQSNDDNLPHHFDAACAYYGAIDLGYDPYLKSFETMDGIFNKHMNPTMLVESAIFCGSVEYMQMIFKVKNVNPKLPRLTDTSRQGIITTLGDALSSTKPIFIKPTTTKLFTGLVYNGESFGSLKGLSNDTEVITYEVLPEILSEWRLYVHKGKIVYSANYAGDFRLTPDYNWVENVLKNENTNFPVAYTIDIGIIREYGLYKTVCVEYNDFWAIGNYGMENDIYFKMLRDRYKEIMT